MLKFANYGFKFNSLSYFDFKDTLTQKEAINQFNALKSNKTNYQFTGQVVAVFNFKCRKAR